MAAAERLLDRAIHATCTSFPSPGLGHDVRLDGPGGVAVALVYRGVAVHTAPFPRVQPQRAGAAGGAGVGIRRPSQRARHVGGQ